MCNCDSILVSIAALLVSIASALIYFYTLNEQRKQNQLLIQQHFYEQWQELIRQQLKIREDMCIIIDMLQGEYPSKIQINGNKCIVKLWQVFLRLQKAIEDNLDYSNWELLEAEYESAIHNIPEELEYYDINQYNCIFKSIGETRQVAFVGHIFGVTRKDTKPKDAQMEAFSLIYERYFKGTSTYFTHLCSMLHFLDRSKNAYASEIEECVHILKDNMSAFELGIIEQYSNYDKYNGQILKELLF